jgi:hypothetical protein
VFDVSKSTVEFCEAMVLPFRLLQLLLLLLLLLLLFPS